MGILNNSTMKRTTSITFTVDDIRLLIASDLGKDPNKVQVSYEMRDNTPEMYGGGSSYNPSVYAIKVTYTD